MQNQAAVRTSSIGQATTLAFMIGVPLSALWISNTGYGMDEGSYQWVCGLYFLLSIGAIWLGNRQTRRPKNRYRTGVGLLLVPNFIVLLLSFLVLAYPAIVILTFGTIHVIENILRFLSQLFSAIGIG